MRDRAGSTHLARFIAEMPKAELHLYLEATLQPDTAVGMARRHDLLDTLPTTDPARLAEWFEFRDFAHFVEVIGAVQNLIRTSDDFALTAYQAGAAMADQNIRYGELTVSPFNHTDDFDKGLSIEAILDGLEEGRQSAKADFGVEKRWVFDIARNFCFTGRNCAYESVLGSGSSHSCGTRTESPRPDPFTL